MPAKPSVFISYRRSDSSAVAGRIYDRMIRAFGKGNVFKDSYNIPHGADFRGVIKANVSRCNVVLVIIGPTWLSVTEKNNPSLRRLDNPNDWVRFEVETGLQTDGTRVIPVLVQNASMPSPDDLPPSLGKLAYNNAITVRDDPDFDTDVARLIHDLRGRGLSAGLLTIGAIILLLAIVGLFLLSNRNNGGTLTAIDPTATPSPTLTSTPSPTDTPTSPPPTPTLNTTATQVIDLGATATEAILQRTVVAQGIINATLLAENTRIVATSTLTASPSPTSSYTPTLPTPTPVTPTATVAQVYPCEATIISVGSPQGTILNIVWNRPELPHQLQNTVKVGQMVKLLRDRIIDVSTKWHQIEDQNGIRLGWILAIYASPSTQCPI